MQHVLVHIDGDLGPIGAWSWSDTTGKLRQFYPESLDLSISGRAREMIAARTGDLTEWMLYMTTLDSKLETYELVVVPDSVALVDVVAEYRRSWNASV